MIFSPILMCKVFLKLSPKRKENLKMDTNKIYNMDCVAGMKKLPNDSIDLTVTSPPYDNLRKYKGFSWDFEAVAEELYRITKSGG